MNSLLLISPYKGEAFNQFFLVNVKFWLADNGFLKFTGLTRSRGEKPADCLGSSPAQLLIFCRNRVFSGRGCLMQLDYGNFNPGLARHDLQCKVNEVQFFHNGRDRQKFQVPFGIKVLEKNIAPVKSSFQVR